MTLPVPSVSKPAGAPARGCILDLCSMFLLTDGAPTCSLAVVAHGCDKPRWLLKPAFIHGGIAMDMVRLGRTGLKVSRICLGTMTYGDPKWRDWVLDEEASLPFFRRAIEAGINFFDTADIYSH